MKFVFLGYDFMLPVALRLIEDGHELIGIMSFECDQVFNFNLNCQSLAAEKNIPFIQSRISDIHIDSFLGKDANLFIAAGYPFKIPPIDKSKAFGINMHPSYLPRARGIMPVPHIILNTVQDAAGLTIHKLSIKFDQGDILAQHKITLTPEETVETYSAKILTRAPDLASNLVNDLPNKWAAAEPQNEKEAYTAPIPDDAMRTLDWNNNTGDLLKQGRAFGRFGCLAEFNSALWSVFEFKAWEEEHDHTPGTCLIIQPKMALIAAKNGFVCLTDFEEARLEAQL